MNRKKLIREQLDCSLRRISPLRDVDPPSKGWIRAIRDALGMSASQLASRLGVAQQAVSRIERDELSGSATIRTMRRIAEGLDCVFVCGFVPRSSLEETLRKQAEKVAARRLTNASQTMKLEDQGLGATEDARVLAELVDDLVKTPPASLWSEP